MTNLFTVTVSLPPKSAQVIEYLHDHYEVGERLPTITEIACEAGVSISYLSTMLMQLADKGFLTRIPHEHWNEYFLAPRQSSEIKCRVQVPASDREKRAAAGGMDALMALYRHWGY